MNIEDIAAVWEYKEKGIKRGHLSSRNSKEKLEEQRIESQQGIYLEGPFSLEDIAAAGLPVPLFIKRSSSVIQNKRIEEQLWEYKYSLREEKRLQKRTCCSFLKPLFYQENSLQLKRGT